MPLRVLIVVENLPVPLDRRVWQEACALRDAGHDVTVICPQMRGYTTPFEVLDGITIYRHWITDEAKGIKGFLGEYASALWGEFACALKAGGGVKVRSSLRRSEYSAVFGWVTDWKHTVPSVSFQSRQASTRGRPDGSPPSSASTAR